MPRSLAWTRRSECRGGTGPGGGPAKAGGPTMRQVGRPVLGFDEVTTMALGEEDDSPVDDHVTTLALGEEDDSPIDDEVTTTALGEEDDSPLEDEVTTTALGEEDDSPIEDVDITPEHDS